MNENRRCDQLLGPGHTYHKPDATFHKPYENDPYDISSINSLMIETSETNSDESTD